MTSPTLAVLVLLWACAAWTLAAAVPGIPAPFAVLVAVAGLIQAELLRRLELPRGRFTVGGEIVALALVVIVSYLVLGDGQDGVVLVGLAIALVAWALAQMTIVDLESVRQPVDLVEGLASPIDRLRGRLLNGGLGLAVAVASLSGGLIPPATPRATAGIFLFPYLLYWLLGLAGLATVNRQRHLSRWSREGAQVDGDLGMRWMGGTVAWITMGAIAVAVLLVVGNPAFRIVHEASSWVTAGIITLSGGEDRRPPPSITAGTSTPAPAERPEPSEPVEESNRGSVSDLILIIAFGLIFASVFLLVGRRRRADPGEAPLSIWRQLWAIVVEMGKNLWRLLAGLIVVGRRRQPVSTLTKDKAGIPVRGRWSPNDPVRRRIAAEFRTYLKNAQDHELTPRPSETVLEFGYRAGRGDSPATDQLTSLYARARYSTHQLGENDNNAARNARIRAVADLEEGDGDSVSGRV